MRQQLPSARIQLLEISRQPVPEGAAQRDSTVSVRSSPAEIAPVEVRVGAAAVPTSWPDMSKKLRTLVPSLL